MNEIINFSNPKSENLLIKSEITEAFLKVLGSDSYILGAEVESFERDFAFYIGMPFCVGVNSGTDAITLGIKSLGIGKGDEVITPSHTATGTVSAIVASGATPVFADISEISYNLDPNSIIKVITKKTKAIVAVHLYGNPSDLKQITDLCKAYNLLLIEDCAQAAGAIYDEKRVGSFGDLSCFSFYPTKNLGAIGDGGCVLTKSKEVYETLIALRQYGWNKQRESEHLSGNSRLDELQAAILSKKLNHLDQNNELRIKIANRYSNNLVKFDCKLPNVSPKSSHVFHLYVIRSNKREALIKSLNEFNIFPGIHYAKPVHLHRAFTIYYDPKKESLPVTTKISNEILSLPIYPHLNLDTVDFISAKILEFGFNNL